MLTEQKVSDFDRGISTAIGRATMVLVFIFTIALVQSVRYEFTNNGYLLLLCGSVISIVAIIIYSKLPPSPSNLLGVQKSGGIMLVVWISGLVPVAFLVYVAGYWGLWSLAELRHGISVRPFVKALVFGYLGWSAARHFAKVTDLVRQREEPRFRNSEAQQIAVWVAAEYKKRRRSDRLADEKQLAQDLLSQRYSNASLEMEELAESNQPHVTSLATLCYTILNMEAEGGRNTDTLHNLYRECLNELRKTGVIEDGGETARLAIVEKIIVEEIAASRLQKDWRHIARDALITMLINNQLHTQYQREKGSQGFYRRGNRKYKKAADGRITLRRLTIVGPEHRASFVICYPFATFRGTDS